MAFEQATSVLGSPVQYKMSPQAKRYTFKDLGFSETKQGNLQFDRALDMTVSKTGPRFKITVAKDLQTLKMGVTTPNGLKQINIYEKEEHAELRQNLEYMLNEMVSRGCFEVIS
ncbi:cysteine desulfurase [Vagococcus zengguangii]|uniref:Cysteine desulfurase n=1 Tax=Vagococcus zengguangii TaxID=2571750 RepID=A0A4D7CWI3_9ENTE|nr:cysteine desulfurase [Vagococcus zengguangii]QCI86651.1 cysteine desulfurase [Vagococcus zengguangii]TLG79716.1 cysteine desulfurase [Vagococcus zengguangii]